MAQREIQSKIKEQEKSKGKSNKRARKEQ